MINSYVVVERGTFRLLGNWWTPICEVAQAEADVRGGIAVSAAWLKAKTGVDAVKQFPCFGRAPVDNNRRPNWSDFEQVRSEIRTHENNRLATGRVA